MESRREIDALRARWSLVRGFRSRDALRAPEKGPFGKTPDGLWDFRGVPIAEVIYQVHISAADLSYSVMGVTGQLGGAFSATACRFDGCAYQSSLDGIFERCFFRKSALAGSTIREKFVKCDFSKASFAGVRGRHVVFDECALPSTNFIRACLYDSEFVDCVFENGRFGGGSFAGSTFRRCRFVGTDLKNTIMEKVLYLV